MKNKDNNIMVSTVVTAPLATVWNKFTKSEHITQWYQASPEWHAPFAENELKPGGRFKTTMAARDGSVSFDFAGSYTDVQDHKLIRYVLDDGRNVEIRFTSNNDQEVEIQQSFEAEASNSIELQRQGWQAILNSFRDYVQSTN